jgi:hypothetical protein
MNARRKETIELEIKNQTFSSFFQSSFNNVVRIMNGVREIYLTKCILTW